MDAEARTALDKAVDIALPVGTPIVVKVTAERLANALANAGYTITRIDPEAAAVAELLALERAGKIQWHRRQSSEYEAWGGNSPDAGDFTWAKRCPTAVELVAAVKAALKEAE